MSSSAKSAKQAGYPEQTARRLIPFVGASLLAWIAVPIGSSMNWGMYAVSAGLAIIAGVLAGSAVARRLSESAERRSHR